MDQKSFWEIIELYKEDIKSETKKNAVEKLAEFDKSEIIDFEIMLRQLLDKLDNFNVVAAQKIIMGIVSDDSYLYFRCWIISNGHPFFNQVLKNSDIIAEHLSNSELPSSEDLLYLSTEAFTKKIGSIEEDDSFPRSIAIAKGYDYDFGPARTKGMRIAEKEFPNSFPRLWQYCRVNQPENSIYKKLSDAGFYQIPYLG